MTIRFGVLQTPRIQQEATFHNRAGQLDDNGREAQALFAKALDDNRTTAQGSTVGQLKALISDNIELSVARSADNNPYGDSYQVSLHYKDPSGIAPTADKGELGVSLLALLGTKSPTPEKTAATQLTVYLDGLREAANEVADAFLAQAVNMTLTEKLSAALKSSAMAELFQSIPGGFRPQVDLQLQHQPATEAIKAMSAKLDGGHAKPSGQLMAPDREFVPEGPADTQPTGTPAAVEIEYPVATTMPIPESGDAAPPTATPPSGPTISIEPPPATTLPLPGEPSATTASTGDLEADFQATAAGIMRELEENPIPPVPKELEEMAGKDDEPLIDWNGVAKGATDLANTAADYGQKAASTIKRGWTSGLKGLKGALDKYRNTH